MWKNVIWFQGGLLIGHFKAEGLIKEFVSWQYLKWLDKEMKYLRFLCTAFIIRPKNLLSTKYGYALLFMNGLLIVSNFVDNLFSYKVYTCLDLFVWLFRLALLSSHSSLSVNDNFSRIRYFAVIPAFAFLLPRCQSIRFFFALVSWPIYVFFF